MSEQRDTPMGPLVPEPIHASVADMRAAPVDALNPEHMLPLEEDGPWWRPGVWDLAKVIGWRWVILGPSLLVVAAVPVEMFTYTKFFAATAALGIKAMVFAIGVSISIVMWAHRNAVRARKGPFCIHCGYGLEGLGDEGSCPECGRPFHRYVIDEFRKDPHFFMTRRRSLRDARRADGFRAGDGPTANDGTR